MNRTAVIECVLLITVLSVFLTAVMMVAIWQDLDSENTILVLLGMFVLLFVDLQLTKVLLRERFRMLRDTDSELYGGHLSLHMRICELEKTVDSLTETGQKPN